MPVVVPVRLGRLSAYVALRSDAGLLPYRRPLAVARPPPSASVAAAAVIDPVDSLAAASAILLPHARDTDTQKSPLLSPAFPSISPGRAASHSSPTSPLIRPAAVHRRSLDQVSLLQLDEEAEEDVIAFDDTVRLKGVQHSESSLDPQTYPSAAFSTSILALFQRLNLPHWSQPSLTDQNVKIAKVSGAMTNAVFFVSFVPSPTTPTSEAPTMLLRVYGDASTTFISRPSELRILHLLSSRYALGPKIHGTFTNGRLEEYFPSRALTANDLRDPETSRSIGRRMAELHSVDLDVLDPLESGATGREPTVLQSIKEWMGPARRMYGRLKRLDDEGALVGLLAGWVQAFDLARLEKEIAAYNDWLRQYERDGEAGKAWRMVFCHNDAQYGNLLLLNDPPPPPAPKHHSIIVVDFEYASPNPYPYDIANHFSEWQADYHHSTRSYSMSEHASYPTESDRHNFYRAYLETSKGRPARPEELVELDRGVEVWRPAGSASWALWGVISAEAQVEALERREADWAPDWEYLLYALERVTMFRQEIASLRITI